MTINLNLAETMKDVFLAAGFEETITYYPDGEAARTIKAIIDRGEALVASPFGRTGRDTQSKTRKYKIEMIIAKDDVEGATDITVQNDKVKFYEHIGDSVEKTKRIAGILWEDDGSFRFGVV